MYDRSGRCAFAQALPGGADPGQVERRFQEPQAPRAEPRALFGLETTVPPEKANQTFLVFRGIRLEGNTVLDDNEIRPLYTEFVDRKISLLNVFEIAARITALYGKKGYVLSRVIVPPQEINESGAIIRLKAVEGYIDQVIWPEGLERYRDFFSDYAERITSQRPVTVATMERYLLLANDLPGLTFRSNLRASRTSPRASTMVLELETDHYGATLGLDNRGTDSSGPLQPSASATLSNLLGLHERLSLGYTLAGPQDDQSGPPELHYFSASLLKVLNPEGLTLELSGNGSLGEPGTDILRQLEIETESLNFSTALSYPFIRTRPKNLTGTIAFDAKNSETQQLSQISSRDRLRIFRGELSWDNSDEYKGVNQLILAAHQGVDGLGSTNNNNSRASRGNARVDFFRATMLASRRQQLPKNFEIYISAFGQLTDDSLLSSQECGFGGAQFGRGFDPSVITGDKCLMGLAELRYSVPGAQLSALNTLDYLQFYSFADYGKIWNIDAPLGTAREDDGSSAGLGVRFGKNWLSADIQLTTKIDEPESTDDQQDQRVFFRVGANF